MCQVAAGSQRCGGQEAGAIREGSLTAPKLHPHQQEVQRVYCTEASWTKMLTNCVLPYFKNLDMGFWIEKNDLFR